MRFVFRKAQLTDHYWHCFVLHPSRCFVHNLFCNITSRILWRRKIAELKIRESCGNLTLVSDFSVLKLACVTRSCGLHKKPWFRLTKHHVMWQDAFKALILYIKLKVCLFVPYTNSHFRNNRNQTLHTSLPWSGRDRRVCMVRKCLTFSTFFTFFVGKSAESSARNGCRGKSSATALYPWSLLVLVWRHRNEAVADNSFAFCNSHPQERYIRDSCWC
jgi:hypothetical protein